MDEKIEAGQSVDNALFKRLSVDESVNRISEL